MAYDGEVGPPEWIAQNDGAFAIRAPAPVSDGHTLIFPREAVPDWWAASGAQRGALLALLDTVKRRLDAEYAPDGYTVSFDGSVTGQSGRATVGSVLEVQVVPRYAGERGGVDNTIAAVRPIGPFDSTSRSGPPGRPTLVTPMDGRLKLELLRSMIRPDLDRIDLVVSFVLRSGLDLIARHLDEALDRGARIRLLTTDYLQITDAGALGFFLDRTGPRATGELEARVFSDPATSFHPKAYLFSSSMDGDGVAYVGSSNLSRSGIAAGIEWNIRTHEIGDLLDGFESLWTDPRTRPLTSAWLADYYEARQARFDPGSVDEGDPDAIDENEHDAASVEAGTEPAPEPWSVQGEALAALEASRAEGHPAGLVVMATGLGKTWLAAFDATRPRFRRVLFVAHREEILTQARDVFRRIRPAGRFTLYTGSERDPDGDVVFATVQSLHRNLHQFDAAAFDYVVIDEFHHAAADSYRRVLSHFRPQFTLGLTATPDRSDAADLLALCADNLVYDCGLIDGISRGLLSPFVYRAIPDVADYEHIPWRGGRFDPEQLTRELATIARADQVLVEWRNLESLQRRTFGFCCTIDHAEFMAEHFRAAGVAAVAVHSGSTSAPRTESLERLAAGDLSVIFTVDLFNEGVDVPNLDAVLLLRPTESPVVFFQQLGRGLRRAAGKSHLEVIDLVGNHRSFLRKARLLASLLGHGVVTDHDAVSALDRHQQHEPGADLPEGCSIILDPEVLDLLRALAGPLRDADRLLALARQWAADHDGRRPDALELALATGTGFKLKPRGGWFGFLSQAGLLTADEEAVVALAGDFLLWIEYGSYTKSYKLVTLRTLVRNGWLREGVGIGDLAASSRWEVMSDPALRADLHDAGSAFRDVRSPNPAEWSRYWQRNPISALCNAARGSTAWFSRVDDHLVFNLEVPERLGPTFDRMVNELVDYRLHRYLQGRNVRLGSEQRVLERDGAPLDATFIVEGDLGQPTGVVVSAAGGTKGTESARNLDYVAGFDLLLERLRTAEAQIMDVHIDTSRTRDLSVADRRLDPGDHTYPIELTEVDDVSAVRRSLLRSMGTRGRSVTGRRGGGNSRKRTRLVIALPGDWTVPELADALAIGSFPPPKKTIADATEQPG